MSQLRFFLIRCWTASHGCKHRHTETIFQKLMHFCIPSEMNSTVLGLAYRIRTRFLKFHSGSAVNVQLMRLILENGSNKLLTQKYFHCKYL